MLNLIANSEKRMENFFKEAKETGVVYFLRKENTEFAEDSASNDFEDEEGNPLPVIPFWSESYLPYARKWGGDCEVIAMSLDDFMQFWLTGMNNDGVIVGLNWDQNGIGYECLPTEVLEKLN